MSYALTILWRPNLADAWYGIRLAWLGTPRQRIRTTTLFFVLPTILFGWILNFTTHLSVASTVLAAMLAGVGWGLLSALAFGTWLARTIVKAQRRQGETQNIVITEEGVERILPMRRISHAWTQISRIEETSRIFILFDASGPVTSIEKSGITSHDEIVQLREFLRQRKPGKYLRN